MKLIPGIFNQEERRIMHHEPSTPAGRDPAGPYKMRLGIWMFIFYAIFYASFVAINLLKPLAMGTIVFAGLNLATVYGFALIIVALVEALAYDWLCRKKEASFIIPKNNGADDIAIEPTLKSED
jgi:antibiotic biosynthesis monooxygenase (ABM) superfamily enzyme